VITPVYTPVLQQVINKSNYQVRRAAGIAIGNAAQDGGSVALW